MKNVIYKSIVAGALIMMSPAISMASTGAENILGKRFCNVDGAPNSGWAFAEDGTAYNFAPNLGFPDPNIYFKVEFLRHPDRFLLNKYQAGTNALLQRVADFTYDDETQSITAGQYVLSVGACQ